MKPGSDPPADEAAVDVPAPADVRRIYCLCAEWCTACRAWRAEFDALAASSRPAERFVWVDVDECEAVLDVVEIETFPTLLVADASGPLFCGPVEPLAAVVRRLLDGLEGPAGADPVAHELLAVLASCD